MFPKFNQLTQSVHEDGKGGYIIKDLPIEKEKPIEQPISAEPVVMRGEEKSVLAELKKAREELASLKAELAEVKQTPTLKTELIAIKEPIIKEPIISK